MSVIGIELFASSLSRHNNSSELNRSQEKVYVDCSKNLFNFHVLSSYIFTILLKCANCEILQSFGFIQFIKFTFETAHHCQLLECLMTFKQNVVKDLLCVIAYGTAISRSSAAKLLFYYWPAFNANLFDRKGLLSKLTSKLSFI